MIGISFVRILRAATQNFFRNIWLSIATTVIMIMTLLIVMILYFTNILGLELLKNVEQKVDLSVSFKPDASQEQIEVVIQDLRQRRDVESVRFVSSDEALQLFRERNQDQPYIEESLQELGDNPLSASVFIVATEPRHYENISRTLVGNKYSEAVDKVNFEESREVINRLNTMIETVKNTGLIMTGLFAVLVILIMFNTVRLAIYSFREEIDIMRLVGASRWFIRGPFVVESILVALLAVILSTAIIFPALNTLSPQIKKFFFTGFTEREAFDLYTFATDQWLTIIGVQLAVAVGLAVFSSLIAIQRYLKT